MANGHKAQLLGRFRTLVRMIASIHAVGRSSQIRAALSALILTGCASPNQTADMPKSAPQLVSIQILKYGTITSHENCDRGAGEPCATTTFTFTARTLTVPAQQGLQFGIGFLPVGSPDGAPVKLRTVWIFAPIETTPQTKPHRSETSSTAVIGRGSIRTYELDQPWELVPAVCTVEIWEGNRRLGSQSFHVVKQ